MSDSLQHKLDRVRRPRVQITYDVETGGAMEIIKTTALITINETLWVQLIFFLIFLFLINRVMFRPVRRNMADREVHFLSLRQDIQIETECETIDRRRASQIERGYGIRSGCTVEA